MVHLLNLVVMLAVHLVLEDHLVMVLMVMEEIKLLLIHL